MGCRAPTLLAECLLELVEFLCQQLGGASLIGSFLTGRSRAVLLWLSVPDVLHFLRIVCTLRRALSD